MKTILFALAIFCFWSCKEKTIGNVKAKITEFNSLEYQQEELKALNDIFLSSLDSADTAIISLNDSLLVVPADDRKKCINYLVNNFHDHFPTMDSIYKLLLDSLGKCRTAIKYDVIKVNNIGNHKMIYEKPADIIPIDILRKCKRITTLTYSRIIFDKALNYGVVYELVDCGWWCGTAYIILIKRINDIWIISKKERLWIT